MGPERKIQVKVIDYARKKYGALCKKTESGKFGTTGWPDYMILGQKMRSVGGGVHGYPDEPTGTPIFFFIEFKAPGGKLTPLQQHTMEEIKKRGYSYYIVDDAGEGKKIIDEELGL